MMKKMKKVGKLFLALGLSVGLFAPVYAEVSAPFQGGNRAGLHENLSFYGTSVYRVNATTVGQQLITGESFLDMICTVGGTVGQYSIALDSASGASGLTQDSVSLAISPQVFVQNGTTSQAPAGCGAGCWCPPSPVRFKLGLVGVQDDGTHTSLFYVHTASGTNPGH